MYVLFLLQNTILPIEFGLLFIVNYVNCWVFSSKELPCEIALNSIKE